MSSLGQYQPSAFGAPFSSIPSVSSSHPYSDDIAPDPIKSSLVASMLEDDDEEDEIGDDENPYKGLPLDEVLDDLNTRFLINLPQSEWRPERLYWQTEQAHWFYEDLVRPVNPHLPSMSQKNFTERIIQISPLFPFISQVFPQPINWDQLWAEHMMYRKMVPCCGAIILNEQLTKCLVVRGMKSTAGWCFPRGKINRAEAEETCAVREVEEETGFDISERIQLQDKIQTFINAQMVTMFIIAGVPEDTVFEPQTRNEIGAIQWVKLKELPTWTSRQQSKTETRGKKFFNVTPFIGPLKKWVNEKKNGNATGAIQGAAQGSSSSTQKVLRPLQPYSMTDANTSPQATHKEPNKRLYQHTGNSPEEEAAQSSDMFVQSAGVSASKPSTLGDLGGFSHAVDSSRLAALFQGLSADPTAHASGGSGGTVQSSGQSGTMLPARAGEVPTKAHSEDRIAALLALLGGGPAPAAASPPPGQNQMEYGQSPFHTTTSPASPSPARGHQASMLAMLSPPPPANAPIMAQSTPFNTHNASRETDHVPSPPVQAPPGVDPAQHASVVAMLEDFGYPASAASVFLPKATPVQPSRVGVSPTRPSGGPAGPAPSWQSIPSVPGPPQSIASTTTGGPAARDQDILANAFAHLLPPVPAPQPPPAGSYPGGYPLAYGQTQPQFGQPGPGGPQPGYPAYGQQQQGQGPLQPAHAPRYPGYAFPSPQQQGYGQR